jgi:transcriptional regulator CtsR
MTTQNELLKELVAVRIKRVLLRKGTQYENNFYNDVGRGVTPQEYLSVVNKLIEEGVITRNVSERGKPVLQLVESQQQQG